MSAAIVLVRPICKMVLPRKLTRVSHNFFNLTNSRCNSSMVSEFKKAMYGDDKRALYWTSVDDPGKHTHKFDSLFYTVPKEHFQRWFTNGLEPHFYDSAKSFGEECIMIRKPSIEIISNLSLVNEKMPILKFVLHGRNGCGKSTSLAHVIHYAGTKQWMVVHIPWASSLSRYAYRDALYSTYSKDVRVDLPNAAAQWLNNFKIINGPLINELDMRTTEKYVWTKREENAPDTPLIEIIDFGLNRVKYATDVVGVVLKELKIQANAGKFKMLVAIDGINAFWEGTVIKVEADRSKRHKATDLSIVQFLQKLVKNDWHNGAVVCTVDGNASQPSNPVKYLPYDLLKQEGFELLDPFLPVHVDDYTDKEFYTCLQYFFDRKWFINPHSFTEEGLAEIKSLSCQNPKELYNLGVWM